MAKMRETVRHQADANTRATGVIVRIRLDRGFGFVRSDAGHDFFFHSSELKNISIDDLAEGMRVEFSPVPEYAKGPRANEVMVLD